MTVDDLIDRGWQLHADNPQQVAVDLERNAPLADDANKAAGFLRLSNHAIGEHLRDWPRARALAATVVAAIPDSADLAGSLTSLTVAQFMAGDWKGALSSQARIVGLGKDSAASVLVQINVQVAKNLICSGVLDEGRLLYESALGLARAQGTPAGDRAVAVSSNNLATELLAKRDRADAETRLMLDAAFASREFWLKCGTWVNEERAEYLLALVHNDVNEPRTARDHGARALEVIKANGDEKVDEAFVNLALANAHRLLNDRPSYEQHLRRAEALAGAFGDDGLKTWFADERTKAQWIGT